MKSSNPRASSSKIFLAAGLLAGACLLLAVSGCGKDDSSTHPSGEQKGPKPPEPVRTAFVEQMPMPVELHTFGAVEANSFVEVKAQVGGVLVEERVQPGQTVEAGAILFRIDRRPFEVALHQADSALQRDRAQLAEAERKQHRAERLFKSGVSPEEDVLALQASVTALQAQAAVSAALIEQAKLSLEYCEIKAPFAGRVGEINIRRGGVVQANGSAITSITQTKPILVTFALPQTRLPELRAEMAKHPVTIIATLRGADDAVAGTGTIVFVDNEVDTASGTIRIKASFTNEDERLWPGEYVDIAVTLRNELDALVIPGAAVQSGQLGNYVFVVKADDSVEARKISIARSAGENTVIGEGLKPGERIVVDGQIRLTPGTKVKEFGDAKKEARPAITDRTDSALP